MSRSPAAISRAAEAEVPLTLVGGGHMGRALVEIFGPHSPGILVIDRAPSSLGVPAIESDIAAPTTEAIAALERARVLVLALPFEVAMRALGSIAGSLAPGTLLVETLSVKSGMEEIAATLPDGVECLGINPLFAPSLAWRGRPVAVVPYREGEAARRFLSVIETTGARLARFSANDHDRAMASRQASVHAAVLAFGAALAALEPNARDLDLGPPPYKTLLAVMARIASGSPEVYEEIQLRNPFAKNARRLMIEALERMGDAGAAPGGVTENLRHIEATFGADLAPARAACAELFALPLLSFGQSDIPEEP